MNLKNPRAFTLLELLVVVAIIALLMTILVPSLSRTHEQARRSVCAANLHDLSHSLYMYAQTAPYLFPAMTQPYAETDDNLMLFNPAYRTMAPSTTGIPSPTVDLWVLAGRAYSMPGQFICPSTADVIDPAQDPSAYFDFYSIANLSYGYQYQHDPNCQPVGMSYETTFPVMADANPYVKGGIALATILSDRTSRYRGNSANHRDREGQNVLFQGGFVFFERGPDVGLSGRVTSGLTISRGRDHCYTYHAGTAEAVVDVGVAAPMWTDPTTPGTLNLGSKSDACLVP